MLLLFGVCGLFPNEIIKIIKIYSVFNRIKEERNSKLNEGDHVELKENYIILRDRIQIIE